MWMWSLSLKMLLCIHSMDMLSEEIIHVFGGKAHGFIMLPWMIHNLKLIISVTFLLIFLDHGSPWVPETAESKTTDKEGTTVPGNYRRISKKRTKRKRVKKRQ